MQQKLKKYAELIVKCGLNVKEGQEVIIRCELDQPDFVALCVEECYKHGAAKVKVEWAHMPVTKLNYTYRTLESLSEFTQVDKAEFERKLEKLTCMLWLDSEDPDGLNGTDNEKISKASMARFPFIKPYRDKHNENLAKRCKFLNDRKFEKLEYKSSNGTDFVVGLNPRGRFTGGGETTLGSKIYFNPNIPSEEVFTSPMKGIAEGKVVATKPLSYQGKLIENFWIRFEGGKAVEVYAEKNQDLLEKMIKMDDGASYLGECALIAYDSPINNTGILFYNTLFDENASCHLALGRGFNECLEGFENMSVEECEKAGINSSMIHVDFMIGSEDMSIVGIMKDGTRVQIFKDGNWAI